MKKKNTWLITGGAGFIGSNLVNHLINKNQKVICVDNYFSGTLKNIKNLNSKNLKIINSDIRNLKKKLIKVKVDHVVHLAALGSVPRSFKDPIETNSVNIEGSLKIMSLAKFLKCQSFVFASSSSVYGDSKNKEKKETDNKNPISPYGNSKFSFEKYAEILSDFYKLKTTGIRFFNVFGPNQNPEGAYAAVIPKWVSNLINNKKIVVNGDGSTSRDFTYIDNVVNGIILASQNKLKYNYDVFNIACNKEIKLNYLLKKIIYNLKLNKAKTKVEYRNFKKGDIKRSKANVNKAKIKLKYETLVNFDEGLKKYIQFMINTK